MKDIWKTPVVESAAGRCQTAYKRINKGSSVSLADQKEGPMVGIGVRAERTDFLGKTIARRRLMRKTSRQLGEAGSRSTEFLLGK